LIKSVAMDGTAIIQALFACLITLQFVVVVAHDWIDVPGWTHGTQLQLVVGRRKLWIATLINAIFPGIAVAFAVTFWNRPKPGFVTSYWVLYCAVTLASAIFMWYIPYFLGAPEKTKQGYFENVCRDQAGSAPSERQSAPEPTAFVLSRLVHSKFLPRIVDALAQVLSVSAWLRKLSRLHSHHGFHVVDYYPLPAIPAGWNSF